MTVVTNAEGLTVAVRQWHEPVVDDSGENDAPQALATRTFETPGRWSNSVLLFDTETTTDRAQRLIFGWYRYGCWRLDGTMVSVLEGILHADDLPERDPDGYAQLVEYVRANRAEVEGGQPDGIALLSRQAFLNDVLWPAIQAEAMIVGFNLPFDLSRLAVAWGETRRKRNRRKRGMPPGDVFSRGFSLTLWEYQDKSTGEWKEHKYRPRVRIKHVDSKRAFIGLAPTRARDRRDPQHGARFLDLKTLAFALTNRGHSLASMCEALGIEEGKAVAELHGVIDPVYIDYARQDVRAYVEVLERLRFEFDRHPIDLLPERAQSPASIAKAYLRAMGVTPLLEREPQLSRAVLGQAMSAYFGGRTECRIRRTPVPVVYVDFLSMYPTVNSLMGLWQNIVAEQIEVMDATAEVQGLLGGVTLENGFDPAFWSSLAFFAQIVPDGDVLPVRAEYDGASFTIGVNPLTAERPLWYAGPDLVASTLLTDKAPKVLQAFKLVPHGTLPTLRPTELGGVLPIDPRTDDFFRFVIEERRRVKQARRQGEPVPDHLDPFLKVLANSGGYGIFAELNRQELPGDGRIPVTVYSANDESFSATTNTPEVPGKTCYPPLAALITSAARLMLALLEREVTNRGGSYAFCDTDSMAIVASEHGGVVPCLGGSAHMPDGRDAVRALSWKEVDAIVERFCALNPYDREVVPGSVLEVEDVNIDPDTGERRRLWCYAISAKRYALFVHGDGGMPKVVEDGYSEHGLGHLLNPDDPENENREWIRTVWTGLIREALEVPFAWPARVDRPAMSRLTASSPHVLRSLLRNQTGKYEDDPKPFNFLISPHVIPLGHPPGTDPQHFHLIAPYTKDARQWTKLRWTDVYSGERFAIMMRDEVPGDGSARVQSYRGVIDRYLVHPEAKSLGPDRVPCGKRTVGLLGRRTVTLGELVHIGKETNRLEEVEQGLVHDWDEVQLLFRESLQWVKSSAAASSTARQHQLCRTCATSVKAHQRYCSSACRQSAYRGRQRKRRGCEDPEGIGGRRIGPKTFSNTYDGD